MKKGGFPFVGRLEPLWGLNTAKAKISRQVKTRLLFVFQSQSFDSNGRLFILSKIDHHALHKTKLVKKVDSRKRGISVKHSRLAFLHIEKCANLKFAHSTYQPPLFTIEITATDVAGKETLE